VDESINVQITVRDKRAEEKTERGKMKKNLLEALEGLPEDAAYNLLLHAAGTSIVHDIGGTSCIH
jgi:hypothetical protein